MIKNYEKKEEILKFKSLSSDDKNSLLHALSGEFIGIHDDKKIIFKHINYNNFAVLTKLTVLFFLKVKIEKFIKLDEN